MSVDKPIVAVLGCGKLGESLVQGWLEAGLLEAAQVRPTVKSLRRSAELSKRLQVDVGRDNAAAVDGAQVVIIATKPQVVDEVLDSVAEAIRPGTLVISVAAGIGIARIEGRLAEGVGVIRAMPNTPCLLRVGMTVLAPGGHTSEDQIDQARWLFEALGRTTVLDEKHMDAVTALSASGPAFMYVVIEALAEGGVKVGLPRDVATELAAQMAYGSAHMVLHTGSHPALLKDMVTTPAGCTIDGIMQLEEGGLRVTLIKTIVQTTKRASELAGDK